jgi:uncharacterized protein (TIGR03437 family)
VGGRVSEPLLRVVVLLHHAPRQRRVVDIHFGNAHERGIVDISALRFSASWTVPVAASAPGIFTVSSTGIGAAAVINQDKTLNTPSNPAPRGTVVQIYATGEGQTKPPGETGSVASASASKSPQLPVSVSVGGVDAPVQYVGSVPGFVSGVLQVNSLIPANAPASASLPLTISIGGIASQAAVSLAVQ